MSETHELLPVGWGLALPRPVRDVLLDLGIACNEAALALDQAYLLHRTSLAVCDAAEAFGEPARFRRECGRQWVDCTVNYTDQLTAVYTSIAGVFGAYAARVAAACARGGALPSDGPDPIRPSHVLAAVHQRVPLVQMPAEPSGDRAILDQNDELVVRHEALVECVGQTNRSRDRDAYDNPARLASRPVDSIELGVGLAHTLHGYAAACVWAIGLVSRPPSPSSHEP